MPTITRELLPKQLEFLQANESEVLYSGAFGAGKTRALCEKLLWHCAFQNNIVGLCRKTLKSLKSTTLVTLLRGDGGEPPVIPLGEYVQNKSDCTITLKRTGATIYYFGIDSIGKIGSTNLGACAIDEAVELSEDDWIALRGRCRNKLDPVRQLFGACNPGPPSHHLAQRFGLVGNTKPAEGCRAIQTCSTDNWFLPPDYIGWLNSLTGTHGARYRDGKWVGFEGLVYDQWDRAVHVRERHGPWVRVFGAIDEGYTNPAVLLSVGEDPDGRLHIFREFYETHILPSVMVEEAKRRVERDRIGQMTADPSAAGLVADLVSAGLDVTTELDNAVFDGIRRVQDRLQVRPDGLPRLTVDPSCERTICEFESYMWRPGKDAPVKQMDHAMDATRYLVSYLDGPREPTRIAPTKIFTVRTR